MHVSARNGNRVNLTGVTVDDASHNTRRLAAPSGAGTLDGVHCNNKSKDRMHASAYMQESRIRSNCAITAKERRGNHRNSFLLHVVLPEAASWLAKADTNVAGSSVRLQKGTSHLARTASSKTPLIYFQLGKIKFNI